jgi:hypothetical protein
VSHSAVKHAHLIDGPLCARVPAHGLAGATRAIYRDVDCPDCLRRVIAETEERLVVLRDLLAGVSS